MDTKRERIKEHLGGRLSVPSLPKVVARIQDMLESEGASMAEMGQAIAQDPPLTARLLRAVNSSYYGLKTPILSAEHAASVIGFRGLQNLMLRVPTFSGAIVAGRGFDVRTLWRHAILTARTAAKLTRVAAGSREIEAADAHALGLLHDIGHFAMCDGLGREFGELMLRAEEEGLLVDELEQETFGFTHDELGAMLVKRWGLPDPTVKATRFHDDEKGIAEVDPIPATILVADRIVLAVTNPAFGSARERIPEQVLRLLSLDRAQLEDLEHEVAEERVAI